MNKLEGPPHDVDAIKATLIETGFSQSDVIVLRNPDRRQIEEAIDDIAQTFRQYSSGEADGLTPVSLSPVFEPVEESTAPKNTLLLFFFSGHGVTIRGTATEYIIPRLGLMTLNGPDDIENSAVSVNWLKQTLERSAAASVIILDTHFPTISF
jgi:uncharacterized caspase-like protein